MKKLLAVIVVITVAVSLCAVTALGAAANKVAYYDENGNEITVRGLYYNNEGCPVFTADCYYLDADGEQVYVGGCRVYYRDSDGELFEGKYCYDANDRVIARPSSYPGGYGCGRWYCNEDGCVVRGTFYYDDFGNPVEAPASRGGGHSKSKCHS